VLDVLHRIRYLLIIEAQENTDMFVEYWQIAVLVWAVYVWAKQT